MTPIPRKPSSAKGPRTPGVLAYVRVSTTEQSESGAGLAAQRASIEAEAQRRGWTDLEWITDAGYSAKSLERPGMVDALARLAVGEASVLCVSRLDRLSRSMLDFCGLVSQAQTEGWAICALDLGVDMTTPEGELMANVRASFGAYERRLISVRTREALAAKKAAGVRLGRPPTIPEDVARMASDLRASGMKFHEIAAELEQAGHVPPNGYWHPSTISRMISRLARQPA